MRAYFKMRTCISLCGAKVTVNKTHISKENNVLPGESETQHKSKYIAVKRHLIHTLLLPQSV
jgi:tRNA threonylcarbamoyladenosine modification (KEOPS) complex Cgi121 subunit